MRYNVLGFDQEKASKLGLNLDELMLLRHFHDFASSGKMEKVIYNNDVYYWIKYDKFVTDLPILGMKKTRIMEIFNNNLCEKPSDWEERFNNMKDSSKKRAKSFKFIGLLKNYTKKDSTGTYSYFAFTEKFYKLLPNITGDDSEMKKTSVSPQTEAEELETFKNSNKNSIPQNNNSNNNYGKKLKTRYHNINQTFKKYSDDELEKLLQESQKDKFEFVPSYGKTNHEN